MLPEPLHPALVHFPIVLGALLPVVAIITVVLIRRGGAVRRTWIWAVLLSAGLAGSAWLAVRTGEDQEEIVEEVVAEAAIHDHEEAAETFLRLSVLGLVVFGAGFAKGRVGSLGRYASIAVALFMLGVGYRVGESGGDLVYEHGAAQAYVDGAAAGTRDRDREADEDRNGEEHSRNDRFER